MSSGEIPAGPGRRARNMPIDRVSEPSMARPAAAYAELFDGFEVSAGNLTALSVQNTPSRRAPGGGSLPGKSGPRWRDCLSRLERTRNTPSSSNPIKHAQTLGSRRHGPRTLQDLSSFPDGASSDEIAALVQFVRLTTGGGVQLGVRQSHGPKPAMAETRDRSSAVRCRLDGINQDRAPGARGTEGAAAACPKAEVAQSVGRPASSKPSPGS